MNNAQQSDYRAHAITTRWSAVVPLRGGQAISFNASFTVEAPASGSSSSWQEFLQAVFETHAAAVANARLAAMASIDQELAAFGLGAVA